jgi:hypothetical protein
MPAELLPPRPSVEPAKLPLLRPTPWPRRSCSHQHVGRAPAAVTVVLPLRHPSRRPSSAAAPVAMATTAPSRASRYPLCSKKSYRHIPLDPALPLAALVARATTLDRRCRYHASPTLCVGGRGRRLRRGGRRGGEGRTDQK